MDQVLETTQKNILVNIPVELSNEIENMIKDEPKFNSKSQFIESAVKMFLQRIHENEQMI